MIGKTEARHRRMTAASFRTIMLRQMVWPESFMVRFVLPKPVPSRPSRGRRATAMQLPGEPRPGWDSGSLSEMPESPQLVRSCVLDLDFTTPGFQFDLL